MQAKKFGIEYFQRLKLINRFFCEKRPLIITICGSPSVGKSSFAQNLASRFNVSNVLQSDVIYEVNQTGMSFRRYFFLDAEKDGNITVHRIGSIWQTQCT